jgi:large subunit ribosomal protein L3
MIAIIGKYLGMTGLFDKNDNNISCSVVNIKSCYVIQIKTLENDGYNALQLGAVKKTKHVIKPYQGHFIKSGVSPRRKIFEVKYDYLDSNITLGSKFDISIFNPNDYVDVTGFSKGKGFQGVVKRYNFAGVGEKTHGQHNRLRAPGSIGAGSDPSRVFKGVKMGGRMGGKRVTIKNLQVIIVDKEKSVIVIKGAVPGVKNSYILLKKWK